MSFTYLVPTTVLAKTVFAITVMVIARVPMGSRELTALPSFALAPLNAITHMALAMTKQAYVSAIMILLALVSTGVANSVSISTSSVLVLLRVPTMAIAISRPEFAPATIPTMLASLPIVL